ncbi:DUF5412 family protein, partial [uncultured Anaerofustis sp.]|uniref:DUF5412 family protein n=1 Tax=uncultured Anaerofustis sp. TaxID=904996 RepID=UPI0025FD099F
MMKDIIKIIAKIFACFILISFIVVTCFPRVSTQKLTPEGEYLFSIKSPYDEKKVNIYLFNGGATTSYYIRGEVEYKNGKKRNIYLMFDMVFNHTSTEHIWFQEALKGKDNIYRDYYIWEDAGINGEEPNNWASFFGGSVWEKD